MTEIYVSATPGTLRYSVVEDGAVERTGMFPMDSKKFRGKGDCGWLDGEKKMKHSYDEERREMDDRVSMTKVADHLIEMITRHKSGPFVFEYGIGPSREKELGDRGYAGAERESFLRTKIAEIRGRIEFFREDYMPRIMEAIDLVTRDRGIDAIVR